MEKTPKSKASSRFKLPSSRKYSPGFVGKKSASPVAITPRRSSVLKLNLTPVKHSPISNRLLKTNLSPSTLSKHAPDTVKSKDCTYNSPRQERIVPLAFSPRKGIKQKVKSVSFYRSLRAVRSFHPKQACHGYCFFSFSNQRFLCFI
jgi:hypothetical protein